MSDASGAALKINKSEDMVNDILTELQTMADRRALYEPDWKEITDFILPRRSSWELDEETRKLTRTKLYSSYALYALQLLSRSFVGYMVSRTEQFFYLRVEQAKMTIPGVADWLEQIQQSISTELSGSNFYESLGEVVPDCASVGTATLYTEEDIGKNKISFSARHPKEIFIEENSFGMVDVIHRKFRITNRQAVQRFGETAVHPSIRENAKKHPHVYIMMDHCVRPRGDRNYSSPLSKDMPWASYYIDIKNKHLVREKGYYENPYSVWRWAKNSDEVYGCGPGIDALVDVKILNQMARTQMNLGQLTSDPPWSIPVGMKGEERILPHGMNYVEPNEKIESITVGANYPFNKDIQENQKRTVGQHFNVDFFLMVSQQDKNMTAREVIERKGEQAAVLGGVVGRFEQEILSPTIERVYGILNRRGVLAAPPPGLAEAGGKIEIVYTGFLEQIKKKYFQTTGISQALEFFMPLSQVNPEIMDNIDTDILTRTAMEGFGLSQTIIRETPDVKRIREGRAQQQQAQQATALQMEQDKVIAQNADKLNQKVAPGTPLAAMGQK